MLLWALMGCVFLFFFWEEVRYPFVNFFQRHNENKSAIIAAERIALVKALSDDPKDIENFITKNVNLLSQETINNLVHRLEDIKTDKVIAGDSLKTRIDALPQPEEEVEVLAKSRRAGGKRA